ncbi:MAG TPA: DNA-3-methyladenine glycosylase I [Firmicutes bacterium]|jgi:DNA-3-methyladenine glycosylase I|nr:DNA-3-methyladenine glycosylase I [Bacillota bacterium]
MKRCSWCEQDELYRRYHDEEWGVPLYDDRKHFEFIILEPAQAGLSWLTILKKREGYREAYAGFNPQVVANFSEAQIQKLLTNPAIIRNERKIRASINNAQHFLEVQEAFGSFSAYLWRFVDGRPVLNRWRHEREIPAQTPLSAKISRDLKQRGFQFVGPTIIYSHLQATGLVNDHIIDCFRYREVGDKARQSGTRFY